MHCVNATSNVCKALIKYCLDTCNIYTDDDSPIISVSMSRCYCNCTNLVNFDNNCYNYESKHTLIIIYMLLLSCSLCLICSVFRYKFTSYVISKKRCLLSGSGNNELPPPYMNTISNTSYYINANPIPNNIEPPKYSRNTDCQIDLQTESQTELHTDSQTDSIASHNIP
jgi:hypothetical protein